MKDTYYFSHDYNVRSDEKIKKLIRIHGMTGYGIFWSIVEDLYNNANALRTDYDGIAHDLHTKSVTVKNIIEDSGLFSVNNGFFSSDSVSRRLNERDNKSEKARKSALIRWGTDANAMRTQCDSNAIKERKGKEINESKEYIADSENLLTDLLNEDSWQILIASEFKISQDKVKEKIKAFHKKLIIDDDWHKPFRDVKNHFHNWLPKNMNNKAEPEMKPSYYKNINEA